MYVWLCMYIFRTGVFPSPLASLGTSARDSQTLISYKTCWACVRIWWLKHHYSTLLKPWKKPVWVDLDTNSCLEAILRFPLLHREEW